LPCDSVELENEFLAQSCDVTWKPRVGNVSQKPNLITLVQVTYPRLSLGLNKKRSYNRLGKLFNQGA
jgi:hypothetical protein